MHDGDEDEEGSLAIKVHDILDTQGSIDYSLDNFLISQGIKVAETPKTLQAEEFAEKVKTIRECYEQELQNLEAICDKFCQGMNAMLKGKSSLTSFMFRFAFMPFSSIILLYLSFISIYFTLLVNIWTQ